MKLDIHLLTGMWHELSLLVWNIVLGPKLVDLGLTADANSAACIKDISPQPAHADFQSDVLARYV